MSTLPESAPAAHVQAELVRMTFQHSWPMSVAVGLTATAFTAWLFAGAVPPVWCVAWFLLINAVIGARAGLMLRFNRHPPPESERPRWARYHLVAVWLNGLAWGLPALALPGDDLTLTFFYATVLCGFVAGGIPSLSYHVGAYYGFAILPAVPFIARLFSFQETFFHVIGVLTVMFVLINIATVRISHRRILEQIRLEFANRELVQSLTAAKERAERADAVKSQFLAAASHDLRQPLHALGLFVDALDARVDRADLRSLVENIKLSTTSLSELLDALLDVSRLDAGAVKPELAVFPVQRLLDTLIAEFRADAEEKGLRFRAVPCGAWVRSDPIMLTRILQNVVVNALRYTDHGAVVVGCRCSAGFVGIEVHDTGPGMTADQLAHVFEEFYQVGNPQRDRRLGLGLGLAIVRRLSAMLGHALTLDSWPGRGTVFRLQVPVARPVPEVAEQRPPVAADLTGKCVLVIDDEAPVREAMGQMLGLWACDVLTAESGEAAVRILNEGSRAPDLVIADFRLRDGESGARAIEDIRAHCGRDVPAILITGDTAPERLREAQAGGHQLLHKPVSAARMRSLASHLLQPAAAGDEVVDVLGEVSP